MTSLPIAATIASAAFFASPLAAHAEGLPGNWITEDHSVIRIYPCGTQILCAQLIHTVEARPIDDQNPDKQLRNRPLCGVQLGSGFAIADPTHARGGKFYDPNSGNTYKADIALEGDVLKVRGYVGISLFGRTETWRRADSTLTLCKQ